MFDQDEKIKRNLCSTMRELYSQKLLTDIGGNLSYRANDKKSFWITPMGVHKNKVNPDDLIKISQDGIILERTKEKLRPSVEFKLHLAIYEEEDDFNAIIHSHGSYSTAYSLSPVEIPPLTQELQILVPNLRESFVLYTPSGSKELAAAVTNVITSAGIAIMQNHGLITAASTLEHAITLTRAVEELIRLYCITQQLGGDLSPYPD